MFNLSQLFFFGKSEAIKPKVIDMRSIRYSTTKDLPMDVRAWVKLV
jgi:hypothetical protein